MKKDEKLFAVFGNPIEHSQSPNIHSLFAKQTNISILYHSQCVDFDRFFDCAKDFFSSGGVGLNVTVPFKTQAFEFSDEASQRAINAGAVNTLISKKGHIFGDNTDGVGLIVDLDKNLKWKLKDADILVIGAGGATRGIIEPLLCADPSSLSISNRTLSKGENFVSVFSAVAKNANCQLKALPMNNLDGNFDIIINATSASLEGRLPDLDPSIFDGSACYDLMYSSAPTRFLDWARKNGAAKYSDGLGMLVEQAAESFYLWHGVRPETEVVIQKIRANI